FALLAAQHPQERRLRDDLNVATGRVDLLGLGVLVALLALAQQRRTLVANHEIVELLRHRRRGSPAGRLDLALGLLAAHRRQLAGEAERHSGEIDGHFPLTPNPSPPRGEGSQFFSPLPLGERGWG